MAFAGMLLTLAGLALWVLYRVQAGGEAHSFTPDAVAPRTVHITQSHTYHLSIPGGVKAELALGIDSSVLQCAIAPAGGATDGLAITAEDAGSKATNQIASFIAPFTGTAHIYCTSLPPIFVDDADDAAADVSGWWLVLATICLTIGLPMLLSVLRRGPRGSAGSTARGSGSDRTPGEDDEIESLVQRARRRADDREVGDLDAPDIGT
jgi:hypothetical protein